MYKFLEIQNLVFLFIIELLFFFADLNTDFAIFIEINNDFYSNFLFVKKFIERVPPGSECSWHIEAPRPSQVVQINFSFFKLAKNCKFHFVALYSSPDCSKDNLTPENQVITFFISRWLVFKAREI